MEPNFYTETATVLNADADFRSLLKPSALLRYVEQVSADHARAFGMDDKFFRDHNVAFLVGKQALQFVRVPRRTEALTLTTRAEHSRRGAIKRITTVTDAAGNVSHPATVRITVKKPSECRAFADLTGSLDQFEAMWTAAAGLTGGRSIGGTLCYLPQETVSRAEFLVMAMELLDVPVDDTLRVSGFADADDAPAWLQPYLASAMRRGIVSGMVSERGLVFRPNEPVTAGQAAVMLQNMLELPVSAAVSQMDAPYWAASSMQALQEAGIPLAAADTSISRIEAARMLYRVSRLPK